MVFLSSTVSKCLEVPQWWERKTSFVLLMRWLLECPRVTYARMGTSFQGSQPFALWVGTFHPIPWHSGREEVLEVELTTNYVVNHVYVMKLPWKPKRRRFWALSCWGNIMYPHAKHAWPQAPWRQKVLCSGPHHVYVLTWLLISIL